jgi:hypothetical protein
VSRKKKPREHKKASLSDVAIFGAPISDLAAPAPRKKQGGRKGGRRQSKAARQAAETYWGWVCWLVVVLIIPAVACWSYRRHGLTDVLLIAAISLIPWFFVFRADLAFTKVRHARPLGALIMSIVVLWSIAVGSLYIVIDYFYGSIGYKAVVIALILPAPMWYFFVQHIRIMRDRMATESAKTGIDRTITEALEKMDSTATTYDSERAANKELATTLKALKGNWVVETEPKIAHGGTADIRVGNVIIEGKLELTDQNEANRLVGQIHRYCTDTSYEVYVVVYGRVSHALEDQVRRVIRDTYGPKRVRLISLPHPHRAVTQAACDVIGPY